jgi:purine nucleoside permease
MRTTVTLDPDVEKRLRMTMRRSGKSFKQVLNDTLRNGLLPPGRKPSSRFRQPTYDLGPALVDLTKANSLAAELEDQETAAKYRATDAAAGR